MYKFKQIVRTTRILLYRQGFIQKKNEKHIT